MSARRKHHIVPQSYLKAWCPEGKTAEVYARVLSRDGKAKLIGVGSLCFQKWWVAREGNDGTRDVDIEDALGPVENRAMSLIRRAITTGSFEPFDRLDVAYFVSTLTARSYDLRDVMKQHGVGAGEEYLRDHPHAEVMVRWQQDRHRNGDLSVRAIFDLVLPHHAGWFNSMHWALYRDPEKGLFTSDQPVVHLQGALAGKPSTSVSPLDASKGNLDAIIVALSPAVLLVATWNQGMDSALREMPGGLRDWYNAQQHDHAEYHLIEPPAFAREVIRDVALPPDLNLSRDAERHEMAMWTLEHTSKLDAPSGIAFVLAEPDRYMPYKVEPRVDTS